MFMYIEPALHVLMSVFFLAVMAGCGVIFIAMVQDTIRPTKPTR